ncbi:MAG: 3-phosphoshikimate 1-carboxyvinyltransferase, partial [Candidatus Peregrinibacteria bacterium]
METREVIPFPQPVRLLLRLPGSKSITNRALLCAALACGRSRIEGIGEGDDNQVMMEALKKLGVKVIRKKFFVEVVGTGGQFKSGAVTLRLRNSGTATRFLAALSLLREGATTITGSKRMQERPIADLAEWLRQLGAKVAYLKKTGCIPIRIKCLGLRTKLKEGYRVRVKSNLSSQYLSALLMVGPMLGCTLNIRVTGRLTSQPYIDMTIAVMRAFGVQVIRKGYREFLIQPQPYKACHFRVEGDATAGTYFSSINYLHSGTLKFANLNLKSIQGDVAYPQMLSRFGRDTTLNMSSMPDAAITLAVTAPFAKKRFKITGLGSLRVKETDRLKALVAELKKTGVRVQVEKNSLTIHPPASFHPAVIATYNDHRMVMAFAVIGTRVPGIVIENPDCVNKSYPGFWRDLELAYLTPLKLGRRHLVLTGMRGAGKTYLGEKIAQQLKRPFIDIDSEIERDQKMSIIEIVKHYGWGYFREIEHKICSTLISKKSHSQKPMVIATGGGVILNPENMKSLKRNAVNVFVYADPHVLALRVINNPVRPPFKPDQKPEKELKRLWEERRALYLKYAD